MLTQYEQLFLELVNAARLDPRGEAARQGIALNEGLADGTISDSPVQALAPNASIKNAAALHSQWMLDTGTFSHTGENNSNPGERMSAAGYLFEGSYAWGENLALRETTGTIDLGIAIPEHHAGLYESPGHRENLFTSYFRETGISQKSGEYAAGWDASMLTHKFGLSGSDVFLTGVIYDDLNANKAYSLGEGKTEFAISVDGTASATWASGGYSVGVDSNSSVRVSLGENGSAIDVIVDLSGDNVKLDLVGGTRILTSGNVTLSNGARDLEILGAVDNSVIGNALDNTFYLGRGDNSIIGGGGMDRAVFTSVRANYTLTENNDGSLTVADSRMTTETDGVNLLTDFSVLEFSDTVLNFQLPSDQPTVNGRLISQNGTVISETDLRFSLSDGTEHLLTTDALGKFSLELSEDVSGHLTMAQGAVSDSQIGVQDALDILRLAVGLTPSFGSATPHDLIAADVDFSGQIRVDDALNTLRAAVGLETDSAYPSAYVLLDPEQSLDRVTPDHIMYRQGMDITHDMVGTELALDVIVLGELGTLNSV